MLYVQAGGGIVADSQPAAEWQETQNKAKALLRAAEMAEAGLDTKFEQQLPAAGAVDADAEPLLRSG